MNIKKAVVTGTAVLAMFGAGAGAKAAIDWTVGHQNIQATSDNIDKLVKRINDLRGQSSQTQQQLTDLQNQLKAQQQQYQDLSNQKNNEEKQLQQQIQDKIAEGQKAVTEKQKEVDGLNGKINDLNKQLSDKKQNEDNLTQALRDAQDIKNKSDQAVEQTK